jgi:hypothetical protein
VLISKAKILGFGLNLQRCHRMVFVGLGDSYETYYQCIRRCWRFGQAHPVEVSIVVSEAETGVVQNVRRKEATADALSRELLAEMRDFETTGDLRVTRTTGDGWTVINGDCVEAMAGCRTGIDLSVYSPPFMSLYTYTASENDIGNCATAASSSRISGS